MYKIIESKTGNIDIQILFTTWAFINFNDISEKIIDKKPKIKI